MAAGTSLPGPLRRLPLEQLLLAAAIVASALAIYWPALTGGWLWDDQNLLGLNPALRTFRGLGRIWFSPTGPDYFPLTATVQWVQWQLWGPAVVGYHLTNVGLHALSAGLLWRLLRRMDLPFAWFGALVFLCHPLAV
jgi:protein O-mannosyl-transferase